MFKIKKKICTNTECASCIEGKVFGKEENYCNECGAELTEVKVEADYSMEAVVVVAAVMVGIVLFKAIKR